MSFLIDDHEIRIEKKGALAVLELRRPKALNALSLEMIRLMSIGLKKIEQDDTIKALAITAQGDRAFCAGGDVKLASKLGMAFRRGEISDDIADLYFKEEYALDLQFYNFSKPSIAFIDGITMGGGVGISYPSDFRVATKRTVFAMPEVKIGFFPDIGGMYHLQSWPDHTGLFAAISGYAIKSPSDLMYLKIATHMADINDIDAIINGLPDIIGQSDDKTIRDNIKSYLDKFHQSPSEKGDIEKHKDLISELCSAKSFIETYNGFLEQSNDFTREIVHLFHQSSPTSLHVTHAYYNMNIGCDFETVINRDIFLVRRFLQGQDFYEGIRAVLQDKSEPVWEPARVEDIKQELVDDYLKKVDRERDDWIL